jgi:hypothetical protein
MTSRVRSRCGSRSAWSRLCSTLAAVTAWVLFASEAHAYTTRLHIVIANRIREALVSDGGEAIALQMSTRRVTLPREDAEAIRNQPLAFRAGAVGPDNVVFPGLTDGTHGVEQDPFGQCELLYREAFTEAERAYALGCFVHGATDAIAHHLVNHFAGETFTLNPVTSSRASSYSNAARHIAFESMIQDGAFVTSARAFSAGEMQHTIPQAFVLRAYFDDRSPVWTRMARSARARYDALRRAMPTASLPTLLAASGFAPVDHVILAPIYLKELDAQRAALRRFVESEIADLQNPMSSRGAQLRVTAGADGRLGTRDDRTACTATCATLYARYHTFVRLLLPRMDAGGRVLPSAFDRVSDRLGEELARFLPALVQTIQNVSTEFNTPLTGANSEFGVDPARVAQLLSPMTTWARDITTVDFEAIGRAVAPEWYTELSDSLRALGVNVSIPDLMRIVFEPVLLQVRSAIQQYLTDRVRAYLEEFLGAYRMILPAARAEFLGRLNASAPMGLGGHALTRFFESGAFASSFNLSAAWMARHELLLPGANPIEDGPASFDASYTPSWTQAGVCDYLRPDIFPLGMDVRAFLSVRTTQDYLANMQLDSPVECHDGSLGMFASTASRERCVHTTLPSLTTGPARRGSLSRAFPAQFGASPPQCRRLTVPGLPTPPAIVSDAGVSLMDAASTQDVPTMPPVVDSGGMLDAQAPRDAGMVVDPGGCGCRVGARDGGHPRSPRSLVVASVLALCSTLAARTAGRRRRRTLDRAARSVAALGASALVGACADMPIMDLDVTGPARDVPVDSPARDEGAPGDVPIGTMDVVGIDTGVAVDASSSVDVPMVDAPPVDTGPDPRRVLQAALGDSVWSGMQTRDEGARRVSRLYELRFRAGSGLLGEVRNPFGPARFRTLRSFNIQPDGRSIETIVMNPPDFERSPIMGLRQRWTVEVLAGTPRRLRLTDEGGAAEMYTEGAVAAPTTGLTAEVRVFASGGPMDNAFCNAGTFSAPTRATIWDFARGRSTERPTGYDVVAGARLLTWRDTSGANRFGVTDVDGFARLGGSTVTDQLNFIVRYTGTIAHTGGAFSMRERDDNILDALWAFTGTRVGSLDPGNLFLEVHGHAPPDATSDMPSETLSAASVPVEIMVLRCRGSIAGQDVDIEVRSGAGAFRLVGDAPSAPAINATLLPPVL